MATGVVITDQRSCARDFASDVGAEATSDATVRMETRDDRRAAEAKDTTGSITDATQEVVRPEAPIATRSLAAGTTPAHQPGEKARGHRLSVDARSEETAAARQEARTERQRPNATFRNASPIDSANAGPKEDNHWRDAKADYPSCQGRLGPCRIG